MTGIQRPVFPTLGSDPESQRLLAAVNELATQMLNSGALLSRVPPGPMLRPANGVLSLTWDTQNRVDVGVATGVAILPAIRAEFVGRPLYLTKASPSGTLVVKPAGGSGHRINSFSGITKQAAGLSTLMNDGADWWCS